MKYRAKVLNTNDPMKRGRIKVYCPKVYGESDSPWCYPCVPIGCPYRIPEVGQMIWIEFESDNINSIPIYTGSWGGEEDWKSQYEV